MDIIQSPQVHRHWISSWHNKSSKVNILGVKEKLEIIHPDGSTEWKDNLRLYHDPVRPFWITKPEFRDHLFKKEFESILHMDCIYVNDSQLENALAEATNNFTNGFRSPSLKALCANPYVYGADIDTQVIIKQRYLHAIPPGHLPIVSRGALDIEAEPMQNGRINLITFMHEKDIYTGALAEFCREWSPDKQRSWQVGENECLQIIYKLLGEQFRQHGYTIHFKILPTEASLIKWSFSNIHRRKTDYISVWNMGFDIPKIIERLTSLGCNPADVFSHPAIPSPYRFVEFREDKSELIQHFTDKWHWVSAASYSQFIDAMCLYARLRKTAGREPSYALDEISNKEVGQQKLHFGAITNHQYMQKYRFLEYIAYNINDVTIMRMMEDKNNDISALNALSGMSTLAQFNRQTIMVRNNFYDYGRYHGMIPASAGPKMMSKYDEMLPKAGGAVLPPNKAVGVGIEAVFEFNSPSLISILTNDLDEHAQRPLIRKRMSENPSNCGKAA